MTATPSAATPAGRPKRTGAVAYLRHWVEYGALRALFWAARPFPPSVLRSVGRAIGRAWYRLDRSHRRRAHQNLEIAFGDHLDGDRREAIAAASFEHFGMVLAELLLFPRIRTESLDDWVRIEGWDHLREAYLKGRGVFLFSGHYGNWELVALAQGFRGLPLSLVTRPLDNPRLERWIARCRGLSGNRYIHKHAAARTILDTVANGWGVAIVIDQNVGGRGGVFVDFFDRAASTTPSLALLALKSGAPIVPVFSHPLPDGRYAIEYLPEVEVPTEGRLRERVTRLTATCTRVLEERIREHPDYWLWMHNRWRTRPPAESADRSTSPPPAVAADRAS